MLDRQQQMQAIEGRLTDLDQRIEALQGLARTSHGEPGRDFADNLRETVRRRDALRAQLVELEHDEAETWTRHDVMDGVFGILDDLGRSLDRLTRTLARH